MKKHIQVGGQKDFDIKPKIMVSALLEQWKQASKLNAFCFHFRQQQCWVIFLVDERKIFVMVSSLLIAVGETVLETRSFLKPREVWGKCK